MFRVKRSENFNAVKECLFLSLLSETNRNQIQDSRFELLRTAPL